jgi:hypothetical protein
MDRLLLNTTAEGIGFTIPGRSSSLQDRSKQPSKHRKKSSIKKSRVEVEDQIRNLSLETQDAHGRKGRALERSSLAESQAFKRHASSSASSSSSNAPLSLYRNHNRQIDKHDGELLRQTSLKIKTFRATGIPDPRTSPDIAAHPANSLPGSPVIFSSESPTIPSPDILPLDGLSAPRANYSPEPRSLAMRNAPVSPTLPAKRSHDITVSINQASALTRDTKQQCAGNVLLEKNTRDLHSRESYKYIQPSNLTVCAPAQHFAAGIEGKVIKIPGALGESLKIVKERQPRSRTAGMGWE